MDQKDLENKDIKSFHIPTKKYGNGSYSIIFMLLTVIFNMIEKSTNVQGLPVFVIVIFYALPMILSMGFLYFLILWIADLIRRKSKKLKPENKKLKLIVGIIFLIIFLSWFVSYVSSTLKTVKTKEVETSFASKLMEASSGFQVKSDAQKNAMQDFLNVVQSKDMSKMNGTLHNLLDASVALQPEIDNQKIFIEQNLDTFGKDNKNKKVIDAYAKATDVRDRHNKKIIELARYGTFWINWNNPDEKYIEGWTKLSDELAVIEQEMQTKQSEFQALIQS